MFNFLDHLVVTLSMGADILFFVPCVLCSNVLCYSILRVVIGVACIRVLSCHDIGLTAIQRRCLSADKSEADGELTLTHSCAQVFLSCIVRDGFLSINQSLREFL